MRTKLEEILALGDFDVITKELKNIKDNHNYIQHPPWKGIWEAALKKWEETNKDTVSKAPEKAPVDPKQPMKDYLNSIGFKSKYLNDVISDNKLTEVEIRTIIEEAVKIGEKDYFTGDILMRLLMMYHEKEIRGEDDPMAAFMAMMGQHPLANLFDKWDALTGRILGVPPLTDDEKKDEKKVEQHEEAFAAAYDVSPIFKKLVPVIKELKNIHFNEKHSGVRSDMEKNADKFGLFFPHRTTQEKDEQEIVKLSPEDLEYFIEDAFKVAKKYRESDRKQVAGMELMKILRKCPDVKTDNILNPIFKKAIKRWKDMPDIKK